MKIVRTKEELKDTLSSVTEGIGFVPTMGALHEGHLSLVRLAQEKTDYVVASIFVNPTQFAPHEDFDSYPRDVDTDAEMLKVCGVDTLFLPDRQDLYPDGMDSPVQTGKAANGLETDFRPHFFGGVANVVSRLFDAVQPDIAVFGEKDYQQLMVIREMVTQYDMGIDIIGAPIARDKHGLALSSRNAYLNDKELDIARQLNVILHSPNPTTESLLCAGFDKVDYIEKRWGRILGAAWVGKTRLIDNIAIS